MHFMDLMNNGNPPFNREPSVSISHEGSDIVFEDLLGPLPKIEPSTNPNKKPLNNNQPSPIPNQTIEELFDDIFAASILTDDEDDESEGYDPNNTSFTMPINNNDNTDVFDSILQDLDEKTKEMDKKSSKKAKKKKKKKRKKKKIPSPVQVDVCVINEDEKLRLDKWEFDGNNVRRNIRVLLSTLHLALPPSLEHKWKVISMSELLNDAKVKKQYYNAIRITHPDKSIGRGDNVETKMICNYIFQALEEANAKHMKD